MNLDGVKFAEIESDLKVIQKQLSRLPTRRELARDRTRHHLCDDDADDAELAVVLLALVDKSETWCLRRARRLGGEAKCPISSSF